MEKFDKILIIDDDHINNFLFSRIIKLSGVSEDVETEKNASSALDALINNIATKQKLPDIIFLDINMPVMDGWQFLEKYKELPKRIKERIKLYMLSSSVSHVDIEKAKEYEDVVDYISKPLTKEILHKIHATHIGGRSFNVQV